ncbi:hypothetical protein R3P38DRAFT_3420917 [Favolaschia claudopus]|uniref:Uncharacterized protein n=1 Tax=Favolaschia claudopus TaxID=2862362 RepID=A0AAW0D1C5_9AGAR
MSTLAILSSVIQPGDRLVDNGHRATIPLQQFIASMTLIRSPSGLLDTPTKLKPDFYTSLYLPHSEFRGKKSAHRPTFTLRGPKEMWSVTRDFPVNCHWSTDLRLQRTQITHPRLLDGSERESLLIKNIITTSLGVSIGPLEYCGIGHTVYIGGVPHIAACKGDPTIPRYHEERVLRGLNRVSAHLDSSGKRKRGRSNKENTSLTKKLTTLDAGYDRFQSTMTPNEKECPPPASKRRRLSADQKLALLGHS